MALMPVQASVRGDFVVLLVLIEDTDSSDQVAAKVAHHVMGRRLPPSDTPMRVIHGDRLMEPTETAAQAGIGPMAYIEVIP